MRPRSLPYLPIVFLEQRGIGIRGKGSQSQTEQAHKHARVTRYGPYQLRFRCLPPLQRIGSATTTAFVSQSVRPFEATVNFCSLRSA